MGETGVLSSTLGRSKCPPQVVENRKIRSVSILLKIDLLSAGNRLAEMGNTLGYRKHISDGLALQESRSKHLSKERKLRVSKPKGAAAE